MATDYRRDIIDLVKTEFIGPCPEENPVENGEETIEWDSPLDRYSIGILYPSGQTLGEPSVASESEEGTDVVGTSDDKKTSDVVDDALSSFSIDERLDREQPEDDPINLANAYHQSAVSVTVKLASSTHSVCINVSFGRYSHVVIMKNGKRLTRYPRKQEAISLKLTKNELPARAERVFEKTIYVDGKACLALAVTNRETKDSRTTGMYTFSLINKSFSSKGKLDSALCFFQVDFSVESDVPLLALHDSTGSIDEDEDYLNNQLLYRNVKAFGIGHGCAATWDQGALDVRRVKADFLPSYEVRPIVPAASQLSFNMLDMSNEHNRENTIRTLRALCDAYEQWIGSLKIDSAGLNESYRTAAARNIENCRQCLARMRGGVALLRDDDESFFAFCLMNEAMLLQQLHYRMPLAKWVGGRKGNYEGLAVEPDLHDRGSWPNTGVFGKWRTFQIAFILMNLKSMREENSSDREIIDLIWFPTGGGKTEAYLGLTAFTLFIRRLLNKSDSGVTVLMRYTLRLLTTQQFERASSLICACESIRERMPERLGSERYSIGLWVGQDTSPNKQKDAINAYNKLASGKEKANPFILLKCPWCGAEMGLTESGRGTSTVKGYYTRRKRSRSRGAKEFYYACSNPCCHFSEERGQSLPVYSIDEDIYDHRPSLVIGTVDKFASLSTTPETRNLFGRGKIKCTPPDLIIQDELHLISGPLGSMVGFFETAIDALCTDDFGYHAKIVGSTATISHAKEQCSALYGRTANLISQFPPSGISADDSFFAKEEKDPSKPGRLYVGICSPGCSMAMSIINLYATLLLAPDTAEGDIPESTLDGYRTNLGYFNSLRELGQAATWISGNILENLKTMQRRRWHQNANFQGRNPNWITYCELTSRIQSSEIPSSLKKLEVKLDSARKSRPVDVCLATNMISVGVDIDRLALMTVDGQPKTTSEYIQATSRVGRGQNPGLVFTVYSPMKARDKSHYEDFQRYHSRLYCSVEPTSVTPFSAPLRDRALKSLVVMLVRQLCAEADRDTPQLAARDAVFSRVREIIAKRVALVDQNEQESTLAQVDKLLNEWQTRNPQMYTCKPTEQITPLIMRAGSKVNPSWDKSRIWEVPTSMRSVDTSCSVRSVSEYIGGEDDGD